jgi:hypothetical protein
MIPLFCTLFTLLAVCEARIAELHYGNELQQFEKYEQLTAKALNVTEFFAATDECERSTVPEKGHRSYMCRYKLREQREKAMTPLWQRQSDNDKRYKVDCKYKLQFVEQEQLSKFAAAVVDGHRLSFEIEQFGCHTNLATPGGATFEIYLRSTRHLAVFVHFHASLLRRCAQMYRRFGKAVIRWHNRRSYTAPVLLMPAGLDPPRSDAPIAVVLAQNRLARRDALEVLF